jgi:hypothetical protein
MKDTDRHCCYVGRSEARGRALYASRALKAGETVFCEGPTAAALQRDISRTRLEETQEMLVQILCLSAGKHRRAIAALCGERHFDGFLDEAVSAVTHVRREVKARLGEQADVTADEVVDAYCKHLLNSMEIYHSDRVPALPPMPAWARTVAVHQMLPPPARLQEGRMGCGLYPYFGAALNHSNRPNCFTLFDDEAMLRVRTIAAVGKDAEVGTATSREPHISLAARPSAPTLPTSRLPPQLTIAYVDVAKAYAALRVELLSKYFFDCGAVDERVEAGYDDDAARIRIAAIRQVNVELKELTCSRDCKA